MFRNNLETFVKSIILIVCIMASKGYSISPWDMPLDINLARITSQDKGRGTDIQKLEDQCLDMLKDHNSPEEKGNIYAKIASMYADKGYSSPNDIRIAKTSEYCRKALELPLDIVTTCEMHSHLSDSQIVPYWDGPETEFAKARKEAIVESLTGLKLVLDNNAPKDLNQVQITIVGKYDIDPKSPIYDGAVKEHQRQIELHKKSLLEEKFYFLRRTLVGRCVELYSHKPYDTDELEKFARDTLKGHDDAIEEIMTKVNERISKESKTIKNP